MIDCLLQFFQIRYQPAPLKPSRWWTLSLQHPNSTVTPCNFLPVLSLSFQLPDPLSWHPQLFIPHLMFPLSPNYKKIPFLPTLVFPPSTNFPTSPGCAVLAIRTITHIQIHVPPQSQKLLRLIQEENLWYSSWYISFLPYFQFSGLYNYILL